jgi:hypothetical protein
VPPIAALQLSAEPAELAKGQRDIVITARAKDARGSALAGHPPVLVVSGATLQGALVDNQDGTYTAKAKLDTGSSSATVTAESPVTPSALLPYRILAWPKTGVIPADGKAKTDVAIVVTDRYGLPVPNVPVNLSVPASDGNLPPRAVTNERGIAHATFTAGTRSGAGVIRVEGSACGAPRRSSSEARWRRRRPRSRAARRWTSRSPAPGARRWRRRRSTCRARVQGGPASFRHRDDGPAVHDPGRGDPGDGPLYDANQLPVKAQRVVVTSTVGTVSRVTDGGDGSYTANVQLPAGRDGPVTIAASVGTTVKASVSLPTLASMGAALQPVAAPRP